MRATRRALRALAMTVVVCLAATAVVGSGGAQTDTPTPDFEPNDDFGNATALAPGTYTGLNVTAGDVDVYAVDLSAGESLSAAIDFAHAEGDLDLFLYGPDGTLQQTSASTTDGESVSTVAGVAGTYYLVVFGFEGATATYDLRVDTADGKPGGGPDQFEPNDDFGNATALDPGDYADLNVTDGDVDVYSVNLTSGDPLSVRLKFSHDRGDLDLFLLGPNGSVLQSSTSVTDGENVSYLAGETGTYYVVVVGFQNATNDYALSVTVGAPPPTDTSSARTAES